LKLLTKTTLFFLTIALFVLFVGGIVFYFSFRYMVNREVRRELIIEMHQVIQHPPQNAFIGVDSVVFDLPVRYQIVPIREIKKAGFEFSDTLFFDNVMNIYQPFRIINYETSIYGKPVRISISKSLLISDELIEYVAFVTLFLSVVLLLCIIAFNNFFFSSIWGNFFKTIDVIKDYNISDTKEIVLPESEIREFKLLNDGFEKMHQRIKQDYKNLKEFIENISHEIQTPLAIMKSKIDLLQQDESLTQSQIDRIQSINGSANRLSNLNKSMILLSKIDNNQFPVKEDVDIAEIVNFHLDNFEDIIQSKQISLKKVFTASLFVKADPNLISIMLLNLLKNSVYHNYPGGIVEVVVESESLIVRNSGNKLDIHEEDIFKRFVKSSSRPDSLGLGLAIVKKICDYYQFQIQYSYKDNIHILTIKFV
jgi:signal transduction histidine kinase